MKATRQAKQDLVGRRPEKQVAETTRSQDLQALVREHLERLPLTYRTVLVLRYFHDQTYEEIAATLSMPIGTVKTRLSRARTLLKERLAGTAPLVPRETTVGTPLTENEEAMHSSGQFHFHGRGQGSTPDNPETDDFPQRQHAWRERQLGWVEHHHSALAQQEAWLEQRRGWVEQQQGWLEQRRSWLDLLQRRLTQEESASIREDEAGERQSE